MKALALLILLLIFLASCEKFNECPTARCQTTYYTFTYTTSEGVFTGYSDVKPNVQYENVSSCDTSEYKANATRPSSNPIVQMLRDSLDLPTKCRCDL